MSLMCEIFDVFRKTFEKVDFCSFRPNSQFDNFKWFDLKGYSSKNLAKISNGTLGKLNKNAIVFFLCYSFKDTNVAKAIEKRQWMLMRFLAYVLLDSISSRKQSMRITLDYT